MAAEARVPLGSADKVHRAKYRTAVGLLLDAFSATAAVEYGTQSTDEGRNASTAAIAAIKHASRNIA
ncbi:hypothetical protein Poly51_11670 [Rubripirellula tenax]|uniref:Uncharacterized protein n=1 Tax=Rubripirellula tenax TaxID=2528015 RepID=A0A5C6FJA3_9BACT|nr:hypothetical protein Poly51_11670 [Rubripirellula tenax]